MAHTETATHRRTKITLYRDAQGFWGWAIGNHVMATFFAYRESALRSAQHHIDENQITA